MTAPGEVDLARMLAALDVVRRPGVYGYVAGPPAGPAPQGALAMIDEGDVVSYVVRTDTPAGADAVFPSAWLTLTVHSSLEAVGLTAAFATALAARSIPANVLAGLRHDHLLVPVDRADDAIAALRALGPAGSAELRSR